MISYDKWPLNRELLLHLTFEEMTGVLAHDRAKPYHPHTLHGVPTWNSLPNGLPYLELDDTNPDWLDCPQANTIDLDFIAGDFSLAIWLHRNPLPVVGSLLFRGVSLVDGWELWVTAAAGLIFFRTNQLGAQQLTTSINHAADSLIWVLIGIARSGASVDILSNGKIVTGVAGTHVNPASAARDLNIGIEDDKTSWPLGGRIAGGPCGPRAWGRRLELWEWELMFLTEKPWLGV